jgi:hypothetical protein
MNRLTARDDTSIERFNPRYTARFEAELWRAYYDRRWVWGFLLLYRLLRTQFLLTSRAALVATVWGIAAAVAFAPVDHDEEAVRRRLQRFYATVKRDKDAAFSVRDAALAEFHYWVVHRRLAGQPERDPVVDALAAIPAHVYRVPPAAIYPSARERERAVVLVDHITGKRRYPTEEAWQEIEDTLHLSYTMLADVLAARRTGG